MFRSFWPLEQQALAVSEAVHTVTRPTPYHFLRVSHPRIVLGLCFDEHLLHCGVLWRVQPFQDSSLETRASSRGHPCLRVHAGMSLRWGWVLAVLLCLACEANGVASADGYAKHDACDDSVGGVTARQGKKPPCKDLSRPAFSVYIHKIDIGCGIDLYNGKGCNEPCK